MHRGRSKTEEKRTSAPLGPRRERGPQALVSSAHTYSRDREHYGPNEPSNPKITNDRVQYDTGHSIPHSGLALRHPARNLVRYSKPYLNFQLSTFDFQLCSRSWLSVERSVRSPVAPRRLELEYVTFCGIPAPLHLPWHTNQSTSHSSMSPCPLCGAKTSFPSTRPFIHAAPYYIAHLATDFAAMSSHRQFVVEYLPLLHLGHSCREVASCNNPESYTQCSARALLSSLQSWITQISCWPLERS